MAPRDSRSNELARSKDPRARRSSGRNNQSNESGNLSSELRQQQRNLTPRSSSGTDLAQSKDPRTRRSSNADTRSDESQQQRAVTPRDASETELAQSKDPRARRSSRRSSEIEATDTMSLTTSKDPRRRHSDNAVGRNSPPQSKNTKGKERNEKTDKDTQRRRSGNRIAPNNDPPSQRVRRPPPGAYAVAGPRGGDPSSEEMDNLNDEDTQPKRKAEYLVNASLVADGEEDEDPSSLRADVELGHSPPPLTIVEAKPMVSCYKVGRFQLLFCVVILFITTGVLVGVLIGTRNNSSRPPPASSDNGGGGGNNNNGGGGNGGGGGGGKGGN